MPLTVPGHGARVVSSLGMSVEELANFWMGLRLTLETSKSNLVAKTIWLREKEKRATNPKKRATNPKKKAQHSEQLNTKQIKIETTNRKVTIFFLDTLAPIPVCTVIILTSFAIFNSFS